MVRRHPHVFAEAAAHTPDSQTVSWEAAKAEERAAKAGGASGAAPHSAPPSALDGIALALPALMRADKLQKRAARVGFDWPEPRQVLDKIEEEIGELRAELERDPDSPAVKDEMGDLLFALVNLARHLKLDSEAVLRQGNDKFERRFKAVEAALARTGRRPEQASLEEMEALWQEVKREERRKTGA